LCSINRPQFKLGINDGKLIIPAGFGILHDLVEMWLGKLSENLNVVTEVFTFYSINLKVILQSLHIFYITVRRRKDILYTAEEMKEYSGISSDSLAMS